MGAVDPSHLKALLGTVGKSIARQPQAPALVSRLREARSPDELRKVLQGVDLGVAPEARQVVEKALTAGPRWEEMHASLVRSAEQSLVERFWPGA
jgi:hypothetical protein